MPPSMNGLISNSNNYKHKMDEKSDSTKEKESEYQYSDIDTILYDVWVLSQSTIFEVFIHPFVYLMLLELTN